MGGPAVLCPHCQAENRGGRRFCAECGALLAVALPTSFGTYPG
ncbi:MAG: zinc-ribbon domain-containing protein [Kiloniellaceae bacterium]